MTIAGIDANWLFAKLIVVKAGMLTNELVLTMFAIEFKFKFNILRAGMAGKSTMLVKRFEVRVNDCKVDKIGVNAVLRPVISVN